MVNDGARPCPLGCGYVPTSATNAFIHLCGHLTTNYTTGEEQKAR